VKSQKSEQASYGAYLQCYISQLVMQFNKLSEVLNDGDIETYKVATEYAGKYVHMTSL